MAEDFGQAGEPNQAEFQSFASEFQTGPERGDLRLLCLIQYGRRKIARR
jgi:hypothetical protein